MTAPGRVVAACALVMVAGVHPVAAQVVSEEACTDAKELIRYLVNEGAIIQESGLKEGVDSLANAILVRNAATAAAYPTVIYCPAAATFVFDAFHSTAEANGVQAVPGPRDRAFTHVGGNGPVH